MLERLAGHMYYYFLDGMFGYLQIPIALDDQDKTTFTCPYTLIGEWLLDYVTRPLRFNAV